MAAANAPDAGAQAGRDRADRFLASLMAIGAGDLARVSLGPDTEARGIARREAEALAQQHGLTATLGDARREVRETLDRRYDDAIYRPTMVGLNWAVSAGSVDDRVRAAEAAQDAVTAAVVEPFADADLLTTLASPWELIERGRDVAGPVDLSAATASRLERRDRRGLGMVAVVAVLFAVGVSALSPIVDIPPLLAGLAAFAVVAIILLAASRA